MANCTVCGESYLRCQCESQQPYCDQCNEDNKCNFEMDSLCVIYHPYNDSPSQLTNLNMPNGSNLEDILEAIDDFLGNNANVPISIIPSPTVDLITSGVAGHTLQANVKVSSDVLNQLEVRANGLYAKPYNENYLVKVNAADAPNYLENQLIGGTDGIVSITTSTVAGQVRVQPSINIENLLNEIRDNPDFILLFCQIREACNCFIQITNLSLIVDPACPSGYTLNGGVCEQVDVIPATPGGTTYNLQTTTAVPWSKGGTVLFLSTFNNDGSGPGATFVADNGTAVNYITTPNVWCNTTTTPFSGTETTGLGPMNRCSVWSNPYTATTQFIVPIIVPITKTYFVGLGVDNVGSIDITYPDNSTANLLTQNTGTAGAYYLGSGTWNFDYWNIYPIQLQAGLNFVSVTGNDSGLDFGFGMEIYDDTPANIAAAALDPAYVLDPVTFPYGSNHYSNLNLVFTTRCARQPGAISANSATCPPGYTLDTTTGTTPTAPCQSINNPVANWTCRQVNQVPFTGYTATLVWDRVPEALTYEVQQKLTADPDSSYVASVGSPVANPGSGSTVSLIIGSLASDLMTFRVRCNFGSCVGDWAVIS